MRTTDIQTLMDWRIWHVWYHFATWLDCGVDVAFDAAHYADEAKIEQFNSK